MQELLTSVKKAHWHLRQVGTEQIVITELIEVVSLNTSHLCIETSLSLNTHMYILKWMLASSTVIGIIEEWLYLVDSILMHFILVLVNRKLCQWKKNLKGVHHWLDIYYYENTSIVPVKNH